jgi:hypothetical protein
MHQEAAAGQSLQRSGLAGGRPPGSAWGETPSPERYPQEEIISDSRESSSFRSVLHRYGDRREYTRASSRVS